MPKNKKIFDLTEVKAIIKLCRQEGVLELSVGDLAISLSPTPVPASQKEPTPSKKSTLEAKRPEIDDDIKNVPSQTQSSPDVKVKNLSADDIKKSADEDIEMLMNPSGFMKRVEDGEIDIAGTDYLSET
jgi:hypothetical protein